jgi:hypothetical protein
MLLSALEGPALTEPQITQLLRRVALQADDPAS